MDLDEDKLARFRLLLALRAPDRSSATSPTRACGERGPDRPHPCRGQCRHRRRRRRSTRRSFADWRRVMSVNLDGAFLTLQAAMRAMKGNGGAIVLTASVAGLKAEPGIAAYGASKAAVIHLARIAAKEGGADRHPGQCDRSRRGRDSDLAGPALLPGDGREPGSEEAAFKAMGGGHAARPLRQARGDRRPDRLPALRRGRLHDRRLPGQRRRLFALGPSACSSPSWPWPAAESDRQSRPRADTVAAIAGRWTSKARASPPAATTPARTGSSFTSRRMAGRCVASRGSRNDSVRAPEGCSSR